MILEQLDIHTQGKKNFKPYIKYIKNFKPYVKIHLKCITGLNINSKIMKLVGEKLYFLSLGKDFLDHSKYEAEEKKTDKLYIIKLKKVLFKRHG